MADENILPRDQNHITAAGFESVQNPGRVIPGQIDEGTGRVLVDNSGGGSGNVVGPASSTDNAIARWDGVTGQLLQNSVVIIGDTGNATGLNNVTAEGTVTAKLGIAVQETGGGTDTIAIIAPASIAAGYTLTLPVDDGTPSQFLQTNGSGVLAWATPSGTGDVVGPASATDNAIARFDGTTGKLIQNSAATVADTTGDITAGKYNGNVVTAGTGTLTLSSFTVTAAANATISGTNTGDQTTSGTSNRISVTAGTTNPVIDIAATYAGQASITTLGTIATGTWQSTKVALAYGGTNADLSATGGTSQYLKQASSGAAITVGTIPASDIASGAALTKTDDTNVTLTLGGSPTTALLAASSLTLGWTGSLAGTRGGTGQTTYTKGDLLASPGSNTLNKLAVGADGTVLTADAASTNGVKWATPAAGGGLTVGTTTIASGTTTRVLFDNAGVLGEYVISGTGNVAMTTSPTFVTPALGTPASGTLTNTTGFPVANLAGAGAGVLTFLATPSSANLATAVTDETGSGALVFATSPTLVTPALGTPASGVMTNATGTASGLTSGITLALKSATTTVDVSAATAPSSGQVLTATSGTAATWQTASAGTSIAASFIASEALTAGVPVGASNLVNMSVGKAYNLNYAKTVTQNVESPKAITVKIATDKVVTVYDETGTTNLKAVVGTINTTDFNNAFTFGTIQTVSTTVSSSTKMFDVCTLGTDKFAIVYNESGATTVTRLVIATVSGTTITLGTPVNFDSSTNNVAALAICQLNTDKGLVGITKATANDRVIAFTVSGTIPTGGSSVALAAGFSASSLIGAVFTQTDKFVIACTDGAVIGSTQCGTVSGTTITLGSSVSYAGTINATSDYFDIISPTTDVFVISYNVSSTTHSVVCGTIATRTITFGSAVVSSSSGPGGIYPASTTSFYAYGNTTTSISSFTISGNAVTDNGIMARQVLTVAPVQRCLVNMGTYWFLYTYASTTHSYFIMGMSNNFIGIAQSTVSQGASVSVIVRGVDSNQSGLGAGGKYLVSAGALTNIATNNTTNSLDDINVVTALSATQILI